MLSGLLNKEFQHIMSESTAIWLNMLDENAHVTLWNKGAEKISGYSKDEVLEKDNIWELLYPNEEYRNRVFNEALNIIHSGKELIDFETTILSKHGNEIIMSWNSHDVKDNEGNTIGSISLGKNITKSKEYEAQQKSTNDLVKKLTDNIPGAIYQCRLYPDGRITFPYVSNGTQDIWELTPDDLLNDAASGFNRIHPDDIEKMSASIENSAKNMKDWNLEYRHVLPKKGVRWLQGKAKPEKLKDGSVLWHGIVTDITEQKKIELELIKSQEQLSLINQINRTIIDTIPVRIFWQDKEGKYLGANQVFLDDANLKKEEDIVGKSDFEMPWVGLAEKYIKDDLEVVNSGIAKLNILETLKVKDEKILDIQTSKSPLRDKDGNIIGLVCTFVDITQKNMIEKDLKITNDNLKQKKLELETIIQEAPNPMLLHEEGGKVLMLNQAWSDSSGYSFEEIPTINDWIKNVYDEETIIYMKEYIASLYAITEKVNEGEFTFLNKNKKMVTWQVSSAPLGLINGKRTIITSGMDITELKKKDKILLQQSKMAAMGEMIGNIAHQWRQPLSTISTASTGARLQKEMDCLSDEQLNSALKAINNSAQYLSKTIDDFRNFFNPSSNSISEFFISDTFDKALTLIKAQLNAKDIEIVKNIENTPIVSIENELIQVLINILNNSRDALLNTEKQKRYIFINAYEKEKYLVIEIKDNAKGIPEDIIDKVFEPYFTTKHQSQGTGIGLYMSEEIIRTHLNGTLMVSNDNYSYEGIKYRGAKFTIKIDIN